MRVLRKNQNHGGNAARGYFRSRASGKRNAAAASALVLQPPCPCTRQLLAQAGCQARVTSKARSWSPCPPHDDRAVIEIQILDPQLQTLTDPHARSIRSWANKRCSPSRKPRMRTTSSGGVSTTGKRRDGRGLPISPEAGADPCTAPAVEERPPMPDDAWGPKPCARSPAGTEMPRLRCCPRLPGDAHRGNG